MQVGRLVIGGCRSWGSVQQSDDDGIRSTNL